MQKKLSEMSLAELKAEAKNKGLKGISGLRKQELADLLAQWQPAPEIKLAAAAEKAAKPAGMSTVSGEKTKIAAKAGDTYLPGQEEQTEKQKEEKLTVTAAVDASKRTTETTEAAASEKMTETAASVASEKKTGNDSAGSEENDHAKTRENAGKRQGDNHQSNGSYEKTHQDNGRRGRRNESRQDNNRRNPGGERKTDENSRRGQDNRQDRRNGIAVGTNRRNGSMEMKDGGNRRYSQDNGEQNRGNRRYNAETGEQSGNRRYNAETGEMSGNRRYNAETGEQSGNRRYNAETGEQPGNRRYNAETGEQSGNRRYNAETGEQSGNRRYNTETGEQSGNRRYNGQDTGERVSNRRSPADRTQTTTPRTVSVDEDGRELIYMDGWNTGTRSDGMPLDDMRSLDSGETAYGILEVMPEGYGFIRSANYLPGEDDIYVSPSQIRRFNMKTGDVIGGSIRVKNGTEKFAALLYVSEINGEHPSVAEHRRNFEDLTPIFPNERLHMEYSGCSKAMRIVDLMSPIGKGQRGMIVSPPKAGKTTLMKEIATAVKINHPEMHIIILLIDERPEEVTDIRESIEGPNVEVIYSTFDELPDHHKRVSEMVLGRAKRLVEHGRDVIILLDSITRLARAYNLTVAPSGRTLSGGLDPAALHMPKKFFGAARNIREGGSLTILATALVDTGSRMDDVVFEEFKGTGNMELVLDRKLSERRIFPAIDLAKSGTRKEDLLLQDSEKEAVDKVRKGLNGMKQEEALEQVLNLFAHTRNNQQFVDMIKTIRL